MKKKYFTPEYDIDLFNINSFVITDSGTDLDPIPETPGGNVDF